MSNRQFFGKPDSREKRAITKARYPADRTAKSEYNRARKKINRRSYTRTTGRQIEVVTLIFGSFGFLGSKLF